MPAPAKPAPTPPCWLPAMPPRIAPMVVAMRGPGMWGWSGWNAGWTERIEVTGKMMRWGPVVQARALVSIQRRSHWVGMGWVRLATRMGVPGGRLAMRCHWWVRCGGVGASGVCA